MVYHRTERVTAQLAARHAAIMTAARALAREGGIAAVQIVAVAQRAGIAAGTVYRYFPSKDDLVSVIMSTVAAEELAAMRAAAAAAPGPLSALAAAIMTFATRILRERHLTWALLTDPGDVPSGRVAFRRSLAAAFEELIDAAATTGHLPAETSAFAAAALIGAALEGLPLAPDRVELDDPRGDAQALTLFALRALGVPDARARGLVVQAG